MRLLPEMLDQPEFSPLKSYLAEPSDLRKRFQLASQIANLFDQYVVFRPELVLGWDQGVRGCPASGVVSQEGVSPSGPKRQRTGALQDAGARSQGREGAERPGVRQSSGAFDRLRLRDYDAASPHEVWQAALWRRLRADKPGPHLAELMVAFGQGLSQASPKLTALPERISIFGISALPPSYLQLFGALGGSIDVHLFLLQPSQEYWGQIVSARESERLLKAARKGDAAAEELHLERGNRLLASMGQLGRDFLNLVLDAGDWDDDAAFSEPVGGDLLQHIQADLYHLRDRGANRLSLAVTTAERDCSGVRPSSGAATFASGEVLAPPGAPDGLELAGPEDGRTPPDGRIPLGWP